MYRSSIQGHNNCKRDARPLTKIPQRTTIDRWARMELYDRWWQVSFKHALESGMLILVYRRNSKLSMRLVKGRTFASLTFPGQAAYDLTRYVVHVWIVPIDILTKASSASQGLSSHMLGRRHCGRLAAGDLVRAGKHADK
jgi:hypothetical protein